SQMGLYYAGHKHWVGNPGAALNLGSIERAKEVSVEESFSEMEIVVTYEDPDCQLVLPLGRKGNSDDQDLKAAA
ncbi:MAG: hypothetical protein NT154_27335, partial [Verrucomicrobia bacterium]|nr:hypothetical protein [Verrucomicrobiota bacterium]